MLPVGTKVVVRAGGKGVGAVAEIVSSPADQGHAYRVRFNDGAEGSFLRGELVVLRHFQRDGGALELPSAEYDFTKHVIVGAGSGPCLVIAVGARAHDGQPELRGELEVALVVGGHGHDRAGAVA